MYKFKWQTETGIDEVTARTIMKLNTDISILTIQTLTHNTILFYHCSFTTQHSQKVYYVNINNTQPEEILLVPLCNNRSVVLCAVTLVIIAQITLTSAPGGCWAELQSYFVFNLYVLLCYVANCFNADYTVHIYHNEKGYILKLLRPHTIFL